MTTNRFFSPTLFSKWMRFVVGAALVSALTVKADDDPGPPVRSVNVVYNPNATQSVQGDEPLHFEYNLSIKSPGVLPAAVHAVHMKALVISAPQGVPHATAEGFVTFSEPVLSFTGPNQTLTVTVTLDVPVGSSTGDFSYQIMTQGWPQNLGVRDAGTYINMHVDPPSGLEPPTVSIEEPTDGASYTYVVGGPAVSVPVSVLGSASESAPVTSLAAYLSGVDEDGNEIFNGVDSGGQPVHYMVVDLQTTNLGTPNARGKATLSLTQAGQYTLSATATNSVGVDDTSVDFTINEEVPPPTVVIDPPANKPTYSYVRGISSVTVPYTFVAETLKGGIESISATLDGEPISGVSLSPLGQLQVTGTGTFVFDASVPDGPGEHTIAVTAIDIYGSEASDAATFVVEEKLPEISLAISAPVDGSTIPLPPDASPLNVPFHFSSSVTLGGTVEAISATLTQEDETTSLTLATQSGLDTPTASGGGTLVNLVPGSYTVGATATNSDLGLEAFDSVTFTVTPPPPPQIEFTQAPSSSYQTLTGVNVSIPFAIRTKSDGAYIRVQSVTLNGDLVTDLTSNANGTALVATGGATLSIPAPLAGTTSYILVATGTDVYEQTVTTQTTFTVTVKDPAIAIAINPQIAANSPYTLPYNGSLTIPFTFTGTITQGATVDTISGDLGGTPVTITGTTGLGTSSTATATGSLTISAPGTYTLTATDTNAASGLSATTSVSFVVKKTQALPPLTVQITQAPQPTYTLSRLNSCDTLRIPITFVGQSNGGQVKTMTATLDGKPISLSSLSGINSSTSTGKATLTITSVGTHVLVVKDTDNYGQTATASTTFTVVVKQPEIAIVINNPANHAVFTLPTGSGHWYCGTGTLSIPFNFTSTISAGSTIDTISASLNGSSVSISKSGIGSSTAKGSGTLKISRTGTYTLTARGTDTTSGVSATTSITFTVRHASPPTVTITQPTQTNYTIYSNCSPASVAFAFKATSESGGVKKLSATLDGRTLNVTASGLGRATATGSGTMALKSAGKHVLKVTASDENGSSSATLTLNVTVATPKIDVKITDPSNGETFTYEEGDPAPTIPFTIEATTSSGATISSLKASLNNSSVSLSNSGIGSSKVKGTGKLKVNGPGTYTLTATAVSGGVSATTKITFTVKKTPAPNCSVEWTGDVGEGRRQRGGYHVTVSCRLKRDSRSNDCIRDSSVTFAVCEVKSNGSYGSPKYYSSSRYKIDSRNQYCFDYPTSSGQRRYRVEVYCFPKGSSKAKLAGSKEFKTR
jgi:hypothetical protein